MTLRERINNPTESPADRLAALKTFAASPELRRGKREGEVNNHVHTIYSFSPYTPSMAALRAFEAGLDAVGSVDHDSIGAAREMLEAGKILGIATTVGFELRVSLKGTPFGERKVNYPDCLGRAYIVAHGVPANRIDDAEAYLKPLRAVRVERTRKMATAIGKIFVAAGIPGPSGKGLDFDRDVEPLTQLKSGGGVTERHLLAGAANVLIAQAGLSPSLVSLLETKLGVKVPAKVATQLTDTANPHAFYDLVGLLKTTLIDQVFVDPTDAECLPVREVTAFIRSLGALPAYAYLGDVGESPTGDKKAEHFEDAYLDALFAELPGYGFQAVTYMPPRNTVEQLLRVQKLCAHHGLMEISGVDINSSRQSFQCPEILRPEFRHLNASTWALIAHEKLSSQDGKQGLFHPQNPLASKPLGERLSAYYRKSEELYVH
ncbi:MAG: PHP domain-containing protein [Spirochaetales bacterium]